ncbi:hypothetical protein [Variovorax sp.]|uniref:hypothetical protein n=1 Tax=Variovorax sp. TaxID=1871043 RepID=UPI000C373D6E|nr:hypothetical protein [Variovorax sp.]MBS79020.1 hypothetical protein [Variovorax sp.]
MADRVLHRQDEAAAGNAAGVPLSPVLFMQQARLVAQVAAESLEGDVDLPPDTLWGIHSLVEKGADAVVSAVRDISLDHALNDASDELAGLLGVLQALGLAAGASLLGALHTIVAMAKTDIDALISSAAGGEA